MITWDGLEIEETAAGAFTRMSATEQEVDRAYQRAQRNAERAQEAHQEREVAACRHCDGAGWIVYAFEGGYVREGCEWCAEAIEEPPTEVELRGWTQPEADPFGEEVRA